MLFSYAKIVSNTFIVLFKPFNLYGELTFSDISAGRKKRDNMISSIIIDEKRS
jgi:hypothetical protein